MSCPVAEETETTVLQWHSSTVHDQKLQKNENWTDLFSRDSQADDYVYVAVSVFVLVRMASSTCTFLSVSWKNFKQWKIKSVFTSSKQPSANVSVIYSSNSQSFRSRANLFPGANGQYEPGQFAPWPFHSLAFSLPVTFAPRSEMAKELSFY